MNDEERGWLRHLLRAPLTRLYRRRAEAAAKQAAEAEPEAAKAAAKSPSADQPRRRSRNFRAAATKVTSLMKLSNAGRRDRRTHGGG